MKLTQDQINDYIKAGKVVAHVYGKTGLFDKDQVKLHQKRDALVKDSMQNGTNNAAKIIRLNRRMRSNVIYFD